MFCFLVSIGIALLISFAPRAFLFVQSFEIIASAIIVSGMFFAGIPAIRAVGRFRRGATAGLATAMPIAQLNLLRFPRAFIAAPAGKAPVIGSFCFWHLLY